MNTRSVLAVASAFGLASCAAGLAGDARSVMAVYLAAAVTIAAIPMGALAVLLTSYLVRDAWTEDFHAPLVAAVATLPAAGLLFVPVLAGLPWLYPWAAHPEPGALKAIYLIPWFFILRSLIYFAGLTLTARAAVRAWQSDTAMTQVACIGLVVYAAIGSLAGIDWMESLEPSFHSSIYGLLFIAFQLLSGFSFALILTLLRQRSDTVPAYGAILLSLLLLWAYLHAMQYIIVWSGDIPDEARWYLLRAGNGWDVAIWLLAFGQFIVPALLLFSNSVRRSRNHLIAIAAATLGLRALEAVWLILPDTAAQGWVAWLAVPAGFCGAGAVWLLAFRMAYPVAPPEFEERRP